MGQRLAGRSRRLDVPPAAVGRCRWPATRGSATPGGNFIDRG